MSDISPIDKADLAVAAPLWMQRHSQNFLGGNRITLLEKIDLHGSLSTAAGAAGMSYKTAWDALNVMNNLAEKPLAVAATGGAGGGGTQLTAEGKKVVNLYRTIEKEHLKSLSRLEKSLENLDRYLPLLQRMSMRISARNVISGTVCQITRDDSVALVVLELKSGHRISSVITNDSVDSLHLEVGSSAYALVKASSVMIADKEQSLKLSARNQISGRIINLSQSAVVGEVVLDIGSGETIAATITEGSIDKLGLFEGREVYAVIKSTSVIIGVD
ncbi:TOBE domain-containing protein [uncultured Desulfuromusa sp.]|uniref:TOBE domain-containing protein n=1 Tax=uncultured Desulfuromusa sp. TaxID=219183 RepID=UPI002AA65E36|nr:TOBE domain-containing protein [uncultured Desulfuromusa sp.]